MRSALSLWLAFSGAAVLAGTARLPAQQTASGVFASSPDPDGQEGSVLGRVVDARTGEPLRGATVTARAITGAITGGDTGWSFLTSHDGRFEFRGFQPGRVALSVERLGYLPAYELEPVAIREATRTDGVEIPLERAASISGRLIGSSGQPLGGTTVRAGARDGTVADFRSSPSAVSDSAGEFTIGGLPAGDYMVGPEPTVTYGADGLAQVTVAAGEEREGIVITLQASHEAATRTAFAATARRAELGPAGGGLVMGRVADSAGRGIGGATVVLFDDSGSVRRFALSDEVGQFGFDQLPAGRVGIAATRTGYADAELRTGPENAARISLEDGQQVTGLTVTLRRLPAVSGVVRDRFGDPIGATVQLVSTESGLLGRAASAYSVRTDARGRFRFDAVAPGDFVAHIDAERPSRPVWTFDDGGGIARVSYVPQFHPGVAAARDAAVFSIAGEVDLAGLNLQILPRPVTYIDVMVMPPGPSVTSLEITYEADDAPGGRGLVRAARTDRVRLDPIEQGAYRVRIEAVIGEGTGTQRVSYFGSAYVASDGVTPQTVAVAVYPGSTVVGSALTVAGEPLSAASIRLVPVDPAGPEGLRATAGTGRTRLDGSYELPHQQPGTYLISASSPGWTLRSATLDGKDVTDLPIDLASSATTRVDLLFGPGSTNLAGVVRDAMGDPASRVRIMVFPADRRYRIPGSRRIRTATTGTSGEFSFDDLPQGDYRIGVVPDRAPGSLERLLQQIDAVAIPVSLREGERKTVELRTVR